MLVCCNDALNYLLFVFFMLLKCHRITFYSSILHCGVVHCSTRCKKMQQVLLFSLIGLKENCVCVGTALGKIAMLSPIHGVNYRHRVLIGMDTFHISISNNFCLPLINYCQGGEIYLCIVIPNKSLAYLCVL